MTYAQQIREALKDLPKVGMGTAIKGPFDKVQLRGLRNALYIEQIRQGMKTTTRYNNGQFVIHRIDGRV